MEYTWGISPESLGLSQTITSYTWSTPNEDNSEINDDNQTAGSVLKAWSGADEKLFKEYRCHVLSLLETFDNSPYLIAFLSFWDTTSIHIVIQDENNIVVWAWGCLDWFGLVLAWDYSLLNNIITVINNFVDAYLSY